MAQKIIIDSDPGLDDAVAILLALQSPELEVLGVTTVFGNGGVDRSTSNALQILEVAGRTDIPVAVGASRPLVRAPRFGASHMHGADGLANLSARLPVPTIKPIEQLAANFIIDMILAHPGAVTLVPIGPLTNIALAARLHPAIVNKVRAVVLMGGAAFVGGNASAVAEANIYNDPHAAQIVFEAGWPVVMASWDVTLRFPVMHDDLQRIQAINNPVAHFVSQLLAFLREQEAKHGYEILLPDLHTIGYLIAPELYSVRRLPCYVETEGRSSGLTAVDVRPVTRDSTMPEIDILLDVDRERLNSLLRERLAAFAM